MGVIFKVKKEISQGENLLIDNQIASKSLIELTEHSIDKIDFNSLLETENNLNNVILKEISIKGHINNDMIKQKAKSFKDENHEIHYELREIDYVRLLLNWAVIPEYDKCYHDVEIEIHNASGNLVKIISFKNMYIDNYYENFSDIKGNGEFFVHLREKRTSIDSNIVIESASSEPYMKDNKFQSTNIKSLNPYGFIKTENSNPAYTGNISDNYETPIEITGDYYSISEEENLKWISFNEAEDMIENNRADSAIKYAYQNYKDNMDSFAAYNKNPTGDKFINGIDIINGQGIEPYKLAKLGIMSAGWNACEVIATYNAMVKLGLRPDFYKLLLEFEINAFNIPTGFLGSNPNKIKYFFNINKIKYTITKEKEDIDKFFLEGGKIAIISFWNSASYIEIRGYEFHTICISYENVSNNKKVAVYNRYNNSSNVTYYVSVNDMLSTTGSFIIGYLLSN